MLDSICETQTDKTFPHSFFSGSNNNASSSSRTALNKIFDRYRDNPTAEPDEINVEGVSNLLGDLDVGLEDIGALIFSELVQSPSLGKVEREPFLSGCQSAGIDSIPKLKNIVLQRRSQLASDKPLFKKVYNHTYQLALAQGQKSLPLEMAAEFWKMLFSPPGLAWRTKSTPWLDWWLEFQEEKVKKSVNKDLWRQTLNFAEETLRDETLGFWSEESSWPSVVDEFVEWVRTEKRPEGAAANGEAMDVE